MDGALVVAIGTPHDGGMDVWGIAAWIVSLVSAAVGGPPCTELVALDLERTRALVSTDPAALTRVYADPRAAAADLTLLEQYRDRGWLLRGSSMALLGCVVLTSDDTSARLDVVDRLGPTRVRGDDGTAVRLPRDLPSRRTIDLEQVDGRWRIAGVA
ncbi:hypothetical protein HMPREF0063_11111 [Aeromicrobium marinum DSM 15272]|uniref:SnoaL-like domain-containing protein n=2 Tax=Aeromicrobium marinum TaxID=219314 RepID=E2SAQ3_9ACTN|nr:hypothetical protein HMPREF0063_11111 [Aeromicrobium marinum DSM 15272]